MARLQVAYNTTSLQEGEGPYIATFTIVEEFGDPPTPDHSFEWILLPRNPNSAQPNDLDTPNGTQGTIDFTGLNYGDSIDLELGSPVLDGLVEPDEFFRIRYFNSDGSSPLRLRPPLRGQVFEIEECFLEGTHILTEDGYRPVEDLKIGDNVKTFDGQLAAIKWIGKQTRHRFTAHPLRSLPIQIKAGALGENTPSRDLFVSPDHAVLIDGLLINAGALENGVSIVKTYPTQYTYYHVELENHALLDAEGVPAESFFPQKEDRSLYDNGAEYEELYPHGSKLMLWPLDYPRVSSKNKVPRFVSQKLMQIANQLEGKVEVLTA